MLRGTFLWRHRVMLTSGILMLLALHMLSAGLAPGARAEKPSLALLWILKPVQSIEASIADDTTGFVHDYFDLVNVRQENVLLKHQVAELEGQRTRLAELEAENRHLSDLLELREVLAMQAVAARVIGEDATELSRTLILSEGSSNGLRRDMAVISTAGVVGKLIAVAPNASRVLLINDHNSGLDAFDQRSALTWYRDRFARWRSDDEVRRSDRGREARRLGGDFRHGRDFSSRPAGRTDHAGLTARPRAFPEHRYPARG